MKNIIVALDFETEQKTFKFLDLFNETPLYVKVGMELFYQSGPSILEEITKRGHKIFLDLKLHDIPNTVERSMRIISKHKIAMTTVHAAGGIEMMKAAKKGLGNDTLLLAVTQLTSTSQEDMNNQQNIQGTLNDSVVNYANCAMQAGCDGVICSPLEVETLKENFNDKLQYVTPGIRLDTNTKDDQKRITTPKQAKQNGSNFIVVGRPITQANDPKQAYEDIVNSWEA